jgi:hypothetical protein
MPNESQVIEIMQEILETKEENAVYAEDPDDCTIEDELVAWGDSGDVGNTEDFVAETVARTIAELIKKGYINAKH